MTTDRQAGRKKDRPRPPQLGEVIDQILDKGVVVDTQAPVSVLDIGLLTVSSRVLIMSASGADLLRLLGVEQPRRRSTSHGRVRTHGRAQQSRRRQGNPAAG